MTPRPQSATGRPIVTVRAIDADDWPLWRDLRLKALAEAPYAFSSALADWLDAGDTEARWRARLLTVPVNLVAYSGGQAAGMVSATAPDKDGTVDLISMWVSPAFRGCGVGDALIEALIESARAQRVAKIALAVVASNEHAISLYARHNFVDAGAIDCTGSGTASERLLERDPQSGP